MSEESDVVVAAIADRVFRGLGESEASCNAALVLSVAAMASIIRTGAMTIEGATRQIQDVLSLLPIDYRTDAVLGRIEMATELLRSCADQPDDQGTTIEGSVQSPPRDA